MSECLFCRIAAHEVPSKAVHETDTIFAFHDKDPQAPVHVLIVPKAHYPHILETPPATVAEMFEVAKLVVKDLGLDKNGFRLVVNTGFEGGASQEHVHVHLFGGKLMNWPPV